MKRFRAFTIPYELILAKDYDFDSNYMEDEKYHLLKMSINFDIYQAHKIIQKDHDFDLKVEKFYNFCKDIISIKELIEEGYDFEDLIDHYQDNPHAVIYDFFKSEIDLDLGSSSLETSFLKNENFENFISFFCGYLFEESFKKGKEEYFIKKFFDNNIFEGRQRLIDEEKVIFFVNYCDLAKDYFSEIDLKKIADKYPKSQQFLKMFGDNQTDSLLQGKQSNAIDFIKESHETQNLNHQAFALLLQENQLSISFEKAIYLTLFKGNVCEYFRDLEQRFEVSKLQDDLFLLEDESLIKFREFIKKFEDKILQRDFQPRVSSYRALETVNKEIKINFFSRLSQQDALQR
jgi:hypothetical protein